MVDRDPSAPIEPVPIHPAEWAEIVGKVDEMHFISPKYFENIEGYDEATTATIMARLQSQGRVATTPRITGEDDNGRDKTDGLYVVLKPEENGQSETKLRRIGHVLLKPVLPFTRSAQYKAENAAHNVAVISGLNHVKTARRHRRAETRQVHEEQERRRAVAETVPDILDRSAAPLQRGETIIERRYREQLERAAARGRGKGGHDSDKPLTKGEELALIDKSKELADAFDPAYNPWFTDDNLSMFSQIIRSDVSRRVGRWWEAAKVDKHGVELPEDEWPEKMPDEKFEELKREASQTVVRGKAGAHTPQEIIDLIEAASFAHARLHKLIPKRKRR